MTRNEWITNQASGVAAHILVQVVRDAEWDCCTEEDRLMAEIRRKGEIVGRHFKAFAEGLEATGVAPWGEGE